MPKPESLTPDACLSGVHLDLGLLGLVAKHGRQSGISLTDLTDPQVQRLGR